MRSVTASCLRVDRARRGRSEDAALLADFVQEPAPGWSVPALRVGVARGSGYDVTTLPLEPYVARVLAGEAAPDFHPAALEALAIAVRTYALANLGRHRSDGFDVCDQTHCQVMRQPPRPRPNARHRRRQGRSCWIGARRRRFTTAHRAAVEPRFRRPSGPAPTIRPFFRPATTMPAEARPPGRARSRRRTCGGRWKRPASAAACAMFGSPRIHGSGRVARLALDGSDAARDLGTGPAHGGRPHARLAAHQEHGVRAPACRQRVPLHRPWIGTRRRHVCHRIGTSRGSGAECNRDPRTLFSRADDWDGGFASDRSATTARVVRRRLRPRRRRRAPTCSSRCPMATRASAPR